MTGNEYEKYSKIFPELRKKKNWKFTGCMGIPAREYIGPSLRKLKRKYKIDENSYDI